MEEHSPKKEIFITLAVLVAIVVIVGAAVMFGKQKSSNAESRNTAVTTTNGATTAATPPSNAIYKDGTYTATASYETPEASETVTLTATLANNVVTSSTVTTSHNERQAEEYQAAFIDGYKQFVIGKAVKSISLSRVSGSSLTSQGFNSALEKIKTQAQV